RRWVSQASLSPVSWADLDDLSGMACCPFLVLAHCPRRLRGGAQPVPQPFEATVQQRFDGSFGPVHLSRDVADREIGKESESDGAGLVRRKLLDGGADGILHLLPLQE